MTARGAAGALPAGAGRAVAGRARWRRFEKFFVTREHAATFRAAPGARALRPRPANCVPGLLLAGAWTDTGWPATMEGAVRSGHAAARDGASSEPLPARTAHRADAR